MKNLLDIFDKQEINIIKLKANNKAEYQDLENKLNPCILLPENDNLTESLSRAKILSFSYQNKTLLFEIDFYKTFSRETAKDLFHTYKQNINTIKGFRLHTSFIALYLLKDEKLERAISLLNKK